MKAEIPPSLFYSLGAILLIFGTLRAYFLGWKKRPAPPPRVPAGQAEATGAAEGDDPAEDLEADAADAGPDGDRPRSRAYKRHITFGVLWIALGLFLILSTLISAARG